MNNFVLTSAKKISWRHVANQPLTRRNETRQIFKRIGERKAFSYFFAIFLLTQDPDLFSPLNSTQPDWVPVVVCLGLSEWVSTSQVEAIWLPQAKNLKKRRPNLVLRWRCDVWGKVRKEERVIRKWGFPALAIMDHFSIWKSPSRKHNASNRQHLDFTLSPSIFIAILFFFFALFYFLHFLRLLSFLSSLDIFYSLIEYHSSITLSYITVEKKRRSPPDHGHTTTIHSPGVMYWKENASRGCAVSSFSAFTCTNILLMSHSYHHFFLFLPTICFSYVCILMLNDGMRLLTGVFGKSKS